MFLKKIFTVLLIMFSFGQILAVEAITKTEYENQKKSIEQKIGDITKGLSDSSENFEEVSNMSDDLTTELKKLDSEVEKYGLLITESQKVAEQISSQIVTNEATVDMLKPEIRTLILELQLAQNLSTIEILLTSKDLSEALTRINNYTALQNKGNAIKEKLENVNKELTINRTNQQNIKQDLESSKSLLGSKKETTNALREKYKGDAEKYKQEIIAQKNAIIAQNIQANKLQGEFEAQEAKEREARKLAQEEANKKRAERLVKEQVENAKQNKVATTIFGTEPKVSGASKLTKGSNCFFQANGDAGFTGSNPTSGYISQGFHCGHDGIDIANSSGTNIYSIGSGTVVTKSFASGGYGNYVVVKHNNDAYSLYGHMKSASPLSVGDSVTKGQLVGYMGTTGWSTGNHLHIMIFDSSYITSGSGCRYGGSKCYNPNDVINF
jgi:murein DD-endopeptidase MepM/ murein hydrolase activator NlpD